MIKQVKHLPARDIPLDTQMPSGNNTEVLWNASATPGEMEVPDILAEAETSNNLDGRGDESVNLSSNLSKLEVGSTEKVDTVH